MIRVEIKGRPKPYSEKQTSIITRSGKRKTWSYRPDAVKNWQKLVQWTAKIAMKRMKPTKADVSVSLEFFFKRPAKCTTMYPTRASIDPDLTNLVKGIEDGVQQILFENDVQVVHQDNWKKWSSDGRNFAVVTMREL